MKNQISKWITGMALLFGMVMLFTQCEANEAELAQMDELKTVTTANGSSTERGAYDETKVCDCLTDKFEFEDLSDAEKNALLFMREEEKLARDVYLGLHEKWGAKTFSNIAKAEQRHMNAVGCLIKKYGLNDPVGDNENGIFANATLQELYNTLMDKGKLSYQDALMAGATIEDLDISDLLTQMPNMDNDDIKAVFEELTKGSRNHLRAFNKNLLNLGVTYKPQYINQNLFDEIINSPKERGGAICGTCTGGGNGSGDCPHGNSGNGPNGNNGSENGTGDCDGRGPHGKNGNNGNGNGKSSGK